MGQPWTQNGRKNAASWSSALHSWWRSSRIERSQPKTLFARKGECVTIALRSRGMPLKSPFKTFLVPRSFTVPVQVLVGFQRSEFSVLTSGCSR